MTTFEPHKWNGNKYIQKSHNCYSYAFNNIEKELEEKCRKRKKSCRKIFRQPGDNHNIKFNQNYTCKNLYTALKKNHPNIIKLNSNRICPDGHRKIALSIKKR